MCEKSDWSSWLTRNLFFICLVWSGSLSVIPELFHVSLFLSQPTRYCGCVCSSMHRFSLKIIFLNASDWFHAASLVEAGNLELASGDAAASPSFAGSVRRHTRRWPSQARACSPSLRVWFPFVILSGTVPATTLPLSLTVLDAPFLLFLYSFSRPCQSCFE